MEILANPDGIHGHPAEGEDIRVTALPYAAARTALRAGAIVSSPAMIALQWLALNRRRLRKKWASQPPEGPVSNRPLLAVVTTCAQ